MPDGSQSSTHFISLPVKTLGQGIVGGPQGRQALDSAPDAALATKKDALESNRAGGLAVVNREADAGALGKATWDAYVAAGRIDPRKLCIFWTSPGYCHCNFTARADFPADLAQRFTQAMLAMDYQQPEQKRIMDLEGLTRWVPGRTEGYQELENEARELNLLS